MYKKLAGVQKRLITHCFELLNEDGIMVYSTCSISPEENEEVIDFLLDKYKNAKLQKIDIKIKRSKPIMTNNNKKFSSEIEKCLRIWPQDNDTSGFFVAKIKKI